MTSNSKIIYVDLDSDDTRRLNSGTYLELKGCEFILHLINLMNYFSLLINKVGIYETKKPVST